MTSKRFLVRQGGLLRAAALVAATIVAGTAPAMAQTMTPHRGAPAGDVPAHAAAWCSDFRLGTLSGTARLAGANLRRLQAAQAELAPGFMAGNRRTGLDLLAGYQEELEHRRPNILLAASYLALTSTVSITPESVRIVNALLCVSATRAHVAQIVRQAEAERNQLAR